MCEDVELTFFQNYGFYIFVGFGGAVLTLVIIVIVLGYKYARLNK